MMIFSNQPNKNINKLTWDVFIRYLQYYAEHYMKQSGNNNRYVFDDSNSAIIKNLFY